MKTQEERLDYLVEAFKRDSNDYKNIETPKDRDGKRTLLRSLMNIRMPGPMNDDVISVQDEYLKMRNVERGLVTASEIPSVAAELGCSQKFSDRISIWQGDITRLAVDAIVNAANSEMLGCFVPMHTCIDNCIHTFAGIQLRLDCDRRMRELRKKYGENYRQPTSVPMLTDAYNLPAKKVVHIVGPIVNGKLTKEHEDALADCYNKTLDICAENDLRTVAFCCISTGVFSFPAERAAEIAVNTVREWLDKEDDGGENKIDRVIFNVFKDADRMIYANLF